MMTNNVTGANATGVNITNRLLAVMSRLYRRKEYGIVMASPFTPEEIVL